MIFCQSHPPEALMLGHWPVGGSAHVMMILVDGRKQGALLYAPDFHKLCDALNTHSPV